MHKTPAVAVLAAVLSLGFPVAGALAETGSPRVNGHWEDILGAPESGPQFTYLLPEVIIVDSSMDEAAIREVLTGKSQEHLADIQTLRAKSIRIPEYTMLGKDKFAPLKMVFRDFALENVADGLVGRLSLGGLSVDMGGPVPFKVDLGELVVNDLNVAAYLAVMGLVPPLADDDFHTITGSFRLAGATMTAGEMHCEMGAFEQGASSMQQPKFTYLDYQKARLLVDGGVPSDDNDLVASVKYYADLLSKQRAEPASFGGFDCRVKEGPFTQFTLGTLSIGAQEPGFYPETRIDGFTFVGKTERFKFDTFVLKPIDLWGPIHVIEEAGEAFTADWIRTHYRQLIPAFEGLSIDGLETTSPRPDDPTKTMSVNLAKLDLNLADYLNGIPSEIALSARGLETIFPTDSTDPQINMMLAAGMTSVNLDFDIDAQWDEATKSVRIGRLGIQGKDLGSVAVAATIGNAAEQIFAEDPAVMVLALMGVRVKDLKIDVSDEGLADMFLPIFAAQQGADPQSYRQQMAGMIEGSTIALLGGTDSARQLGQALSNFISGTTGSVSISVVAKDPAGLAIPVLMQASQNPQILGDQVTITANAP